MIPISQCVHRHAGLPAVVVGGGPSAPAAFVGEGPHPPQRAIYFSANGHGVLLSQTGVCPRPDYLVCMDKLEDRLRPMGVPIISTREFADIRLYDVRLRNSGMLAAYAAWVLGCAPIVLVGMDCYDGATYFHDASAKSTGKNMPAAKHLERWGALAQISSGMYRAIGGKLGALYPPYDPAEPPAALPDAETVRSRVLGQHVKILRRPPGLPGYRPGEVYQVSRKEAARLLNSRSAVKV